jgi:hypothetical protein
MARPEKQWLDYFSFDVFIDNDTKIQVLEMETWLEWFAIFIKLLCHIYNNWYYCERDDRKQKLFARNKLIDTAELDKVVSICLSEWIFNKEMYEKYGILTSKGIQKRLVAWIWRRKSYTFIEQYLLITKEYIKDNIWKVNVYINSINVYINSVNDDINSVNVYINTIKDDINSVNAYINTQSKVKENKVKESKINKNKINESIDESIPEQSSDLFDESIEEFWKPDINLLIKEIKDFCNKNWVSYDKEDERNFWKHIMTAKEYWEFCKSIGQDRIQFALNVLKASIQISYRKWVCSWPKKIYQNYSEVYNQTKLKNNKNTNYILPWID